VYVGVGWPVRTVWFCVFVYLVADVLVEVEVHVGISRSVDLCVEKRVRVEVFIRGGTLEHRGLCVLWYLTGRAVM
jgi:hypothetical protein